MRPRKKVLCSLGLGRYEALLTISGATLRAYAERHGYEVELRTGGLAIPRPLAWGKILLMQELLDRYELILWIDADAVVVDPAEDIATELVPEAWMYMVQHQTPRGLIPNAGVWMLRSGPEATAFLRDVWAQEQFTDHGWWENAAVLHLLGYRLDPLPVVPGPPTVYSRGVRFIDPAWNSVPVAPAPLPRITHFPGMAVEERAQRMHQALERLRR